MEIWRHPNVQGTRVDALRRQINRKYELQLSTYFELHKWSVNEIELFAKEMWDFCGIVHSVPPTQVGTGLKRMYPRPTWFPGARLNYTENMLAVGLACHPDAIAVSACREASTEWRNLTWKQLRDEVEIWTSALKHRGVVAGDRIAGTEFLISDELKSSTDVLSMVLTNSIECLVVLLAAGAIGAIFSSTAPDMGAKGIVERYSQLKPKLLFIETTVLYAGKHHNLEQKMSEAVKKLQSDVSELEETIIISSDLLPLRKVYAKESSAV
jgi:acetoacetyl-CoA synthetase